MLRALVSLSALRLVCKDNDNAAIIERFALVLVKIFDADFVYVSVPVHSHDLELACGRGGRVSTASVLEVRASLQDVPYKRPCRIQSAVSGEPTTVLSIPLGIRGRTLLAVAVNRPNFPSEFDKLIMRVAANELTVAIELEEHFSVATKVSAVASLSLNFIGIADLQGVPIYVNPAGLKMVGMASIEEARELHVADFLEFRDRDRARYAVWPEVLSNGRWSSQLSFLNAKTGKGIPMMVESIRIDTSARKPVAVGTISVDIRNWNRAESISNDASAFANTRQLMHAVARIESLSGREREVLDSLVGGHSHKEIALQLGISVRTIEVHRSRMMRRLGVRTLAEAVKLAVISGAVR